MSQKKKKRAAPKQQRPASRAPLFIVLGGVVLIGLAVVLLASSGQPAPKATPLTTFICREAKRLVRTMGSSAQIQQFEVIADRKTHLGPFTIADAGRIHRFPVDITAKRLRFNVLKSNGGNTGAVEIEALTVP